MHSNNPHVAIIGILSGLAFTFGFGVGIQLYNATSDSSSNLNKIENVTEKSALHFASKF